MLSKTKIEWCDYVWNPVIGCKTGCKFCYAKKINDRFHFIKNWDEPEWRENSFNKSFPKKSARIFINSMSDICYWEDIWMRRVLDKIKKYPQHTFLFLTKDFDIYADYEFLKNCWLGYTIINQKQMDILAYDDAFYPPEKKNKFFISIEPMQEDIILRITCDLLIIGAETGNRKNKIIPKQEWIANLLLQADKDNIPVFMKDNLKPIYGDNLIQEFPKDK
jgi:protein gp37